jgi:Flp pilus assembly protein TadD
VDRRHLGWRAETIVLSLILFLVLALPLAIGGVHAETVAGALALAALGTIMAAHDASRHGERLHLTQFGAWFALLIWFGLLQCLPLPEWLGGVLSPEGMALHRDAASLLESTLADAMHPLSLDPGASLVEAMRLSLGLFVFALVFNHVRVRLSTGETILASVAAAGALVVGVGMAQFVLGTGILLGAYEAGAGAVERFFVATFVNENHLAGFLNLGALVALGCAQATTRYRARVFHGAVFLACVTGTLFSFSRGGIVALVAGCALFAALNWRDNQKHARRVRLNTSGWLASLTIGVTLLASAVYIFVTPDLLALPGFINEGDDAKFLSWSRVWALLQDHPLVGIGAGAFGDVFSRYNDVMPGVEFTHVENVLLQPFIDHGLIVGSAVVAWGAMIFGPVLQRATSSPESRGAALGLFVLGMQNLVDFSLAVSGVMVPAVAVMAVLVARDRDKHPHAGGWRLRLALSSRSWWAMAAGALILVSVALNAHSTIGDEAIDVGMDARRAEALGQSTTEDGSGIAWLAEAVLARPVDSHLFHAEGVNYYLRGNVEDATRWLQASVDRAPHTWGARLMLARITSEAGDLEGTVLAYRELLLDFPGRRLRVFREMAARESASSLFLEAVPEDVESVLEANFWLLSNGRQGWAWKLLDARTQQSPQDPVLRRALVLVLLGDDRLTAVAERAVTEFMALHPELADGYLFQGYLFERGADHVEALTMFREAMERDPANLDAAVAHVRGLEAIGDLAGMRAEIGSLRPALRGHPRLGAEMHRVLSRASQRGERWDQAIIEMELAATLAPRRAHLHYELGLLHLRVSDRVHARQGFARALALDKDHPHAAAALEKLKE